MKTTRPQRTVISLAIAAALSAMTPTAVFAQTVISVDTTATQRWSDDDFTVNSGVTLQSDPGEHALYADSGGTLGSLINNGTISGADGGVANSGYINQLHNNGSVSGVTYYGIANFLGARINEFRNSGSVSGSTAGLMNAGQIDNFINQQTGVIHGVENSTGAIITDLLNEGTITKLENSGSIRSSSPWGIGLANTGTLTLLENKTGASIQSLYNSGSIVTLNNEGTLSGLFGLINGGDVYFGVGMLSGSGSIGELNNSGSIKGTGDAGIANYAGTISILKNSGTISSDVTDAIFNNSGSEITALTNTTDGIIGGLATGIFNAGLITDLTNHGEISGYTAISNGGVIDVGGSPVGYSGAIGTLINTGTIRSSSSNDAIAILNASSLSTIGLLSNSGSISSDMIAIFNVGTIDKLDNGTLGTITGAVGIANSGTLTELINSGKISASGTPPVMYSAGVFNNGLITSLVNNQSGIVSDGYAGIANLTGGMITTLSNNGLIKGTDIGIFNDGGEVVTLTNNGAIEGDNQSGILNRGAIGTLNNTHRIYGWGRGIDNSSGATIAELNNTGTISSDDEAGLSNSGTITTLNNKLGGRIENGLSNNASGIIDTLDNKGTIVGSSSSNSSYALYNEGYIGVLNNSGLLTSPVDAVYLDAGSNIGRFINSGKIAGAFRNYSGEPLVLHGGTGTTFGVLTGSSGGIGAADIGLIDNPDAQFVFSSGNQLLNDHINVGMNGYSVINSAGVLQVNNQINIAGNYEQLAAATLNIGVASNAVANGASADLGYGRLIVSGSANVESGSSIMLKNTGSYRFANGQRYLVVQANSVGTNYNQTTLNYGASGFNGTITGSAVADGANLSLVLTLDGGTENQATNSNAQNTLNGLFNYSGTNAGLMNLFNAAAAAGSSEEGNRAGGQLNPAAGQAGVAGASTAISTQVQGITFDRLNNNSTIASSGSNGLSAGDGMRDQAAWGQAFGGKASTDARDGVSGYHASYAGLLLGADTAWNEQWRVGGLFNYASTSVSNDDYNAGSYSRVNSYGLSAYAGYTGEPWYLNVSVGAMRSDVKAHRLVDFTGFRGIADSSYKGMQYIAAAQLGYPIKIDQVLPGAVLTPLAGLVYSSLHQDGYTETGGNGAALQVGSSNTHSVKSDLGFKLERAYKTTYGLLKPSVQLLWRHEYSDTRLQSVANFAADTTGATTFTTQGAKPVKDTGVLSLGATLLRNDKLTLSANYTLEQGGGYSSQTGSLLARWRF
jgi:outer membrane autotransporter protein